MKYIKLFEDWNDLPSIFQIPQQLRKNSERLLNKLSGLDEKNLYANDEEMKEIEKIKKYFKWWYSQPKVISKLNVKGDKNSVANRIVEYIDKKLVPSEFRIFRSEEESKKYLEIAYDKNKTSSLGWVWSHTDFIFINLHLIKEGGRQLYETVLHEVAHLIQMFASQELEAELYNPTMPKGSYGTDSIKSGLFLPPLDFKHFLKPYANREIEQFARFHVMRYYFGIKPGDNCSQICEKIKKNIKNGNYALHLMERENGEKYLLYNMVEYDNNPHRKVHDWENSIPHGLNDNLYWYIESLGIKTTRESEKHLKNKGWSDMELEKLSEFESLLDLNTICHDHQNIVSNLDIDEKNLA